MVFYWAVFLVLALGAVTFQIQLVRPGGPSDDPPQPQTMLALTAAFLIIVIGLRFRVGGDWDNYQTAFDQISRWDFWQALARSRQEPGFTVVNWVGAQLGARLWFVNFVCAVPFAWGLIRLCRQQPNPWLALLVAWPVLIIVVGMGFTRQAAAAGFLMGGIADYIERRKLDRCLILILVGGLFHKTVLIFIPVLFLAGSRNKFVSIALLLLALVLAYFTVFASVTSSYSAGYINERYEAAGAEARVMMTVLPALLMVCAKDRFYRTPEERKVWRTFGILSLLAGLAVFLVASSVIVDRLAMYLIPLQMFVLGRMSLVFGKDPQWRLFVIGLMGLVLFVWLNFGHFAFGWLPYRSYLTL